MRAGYNQVMKEIVTSNLFNKELDNQILHKPAEGDSKSRDKGKNNKRER